MIYDEHNDSTCTLRLRVWTPDEQPSDDGCECVLQQRVNGGWLDCGQFEFMELAMMRAKDASVLLFERGLTRRDQYRLVRRGTAKPFSCFDVYEGVLYPSTAPAIDHVA